MSTPFSPWLMPPDVRFVFFVAYGLSRRMHEGHDAAFKAAWAYAKKVWERFDLHLSMFGAVSAVETAELHDEGLALWQQLEKLGAP